MRDRIISAVIGMSGRFGFVLASRAGPIDFRGIEVSPDGAIKRASGFPCLIDVPLKHIRNMGPAWGLPCFRCEKDAGNPFIETLSQYFTDEKISYERSYLKAYYDSFQPDTVADVLDLRIDRSSHLLLSQPPLLTFPPWARPPLDDYRAHLKRREDMIGVESRSLGKKLRIEDGWAGFGPVNDAKGGFELKRLITVANRIRAEGYQTLVGAESVRAVALRANSQFRFLCTHGQHRTSALAALGYEAVPITPATHVVDRDDVMNWPGVKASVFTPEQALQIFDMFFHGQPPKAAMRWWEELQSRRQNQLNTATH